MINFPSSPIIGQEHTENGKTWVWDGARWLPKATAADPAEAIHAAPAKAVPADADEFGFVDSAASWSLKKLTWANLRAVLLAYFKGQFREQLAAPRTYYVRTDGSDSNTGLSNTAGGAFATIQKAVDTAASLDLGVYDVTIRCTGTYTATTTLKTLVGAGKVIIRGAADDMTTMVVSVAGGACFTLGAGISGVYELAHMRVTATGSANSINGSGSGGTIRLSDIDFGPCGVSHVQCAHAQSINAVGPLLISGSAARFASVNGGQLRLDSVTLTLTGTPAFMEFVQVGRCGLLATFGLSISGSATGSRYNLSTNGVIVTGGAGTNFLPGNTAGTNADGSGVYS